MATQIHRKINTLEIHANLGYAGGQRNMITFAKYLRKDFFNVTVCAYRSGGPLEELLKNIGIDYFVANENVEVILKIVKDKKIDVIHMHRSGKAIEIETAIVKGAKKINPKLVFIEKNVFGKYDSTLEGLIDCSMFQSMMHLNERYLSNFGKEFDFLKQKVLYNMVDGEEFNSYLLSEDQIDKYKKTNNIAKNDFVIGKVARPALEKWSDLIIEMVPVLEKLLTNFKVVIIGCPPSRERMVKKSKYAKYFVFLPETKNQAELHHFYQAIDALAHCSKIGECNGNTINEAMFWKKPVVVNSTPRKDNGQLEQVIHLQNGIVANNPFTFARALAFLSSNPLECRKMGESGFRQTQTVNNPREVTAQMEKLFCEKAIKNGVVEALPINEEYVNIMYRPNVEKIRAYRAEYLERLKWDFGTISPKERWYLYLLAPKRFYYKIKDFAQHKWQSYVRK